MNRHLRTVFSILVLLIGCSDQDERPIPPVGLYELAPTVIGEDELGDSLAVFSNVRDARFVGEHVAVLDADPPFIRLFDKGGQLERALVRRGQGPGESNGPVSFATPREGQLHLVERSRIVVLDTAGRYLEAHDFRGERLRGVAQGCRGGLLILSTPVTDIDGRGVLIEQFRDGARDTLLTVDSLRNNQTSSHPLLTVRSEGALLLYPEDVSQSRLVGITCANGFAEDIEIEPLGSREWWETRDDGGFALHPAEPPLVAGLARVGSTVLWATNVIESAGAGADSLTYLTEIGERPRRMALRGWYKLRDSDGSDRLLLSAYYPVPHVAVVHAEQITSRLRTYPAAEPRR
jgi:hypothetical protein